MRGGDLERGEPDRAVERRTASLPGRRPVEEDHQAAWLARAPTCPDLTALAGDDAPGRVRRPRAAQVTQNRRFEAPTHRPISSNKSSSRSARREA